MSRPEVWSIERLARAGHANTYVWCLPRFADLAGQTLAAPQVDHLEDVPSDAETLVVIGGGTRIDEAKLWRREHRRALRLIAVPSVWGSGAEASPVVAVNREGGKFIDIDDALIPDVRVSWPALARELSSERATDACGDTWSHALEAFLSPVATHDLRIDTAELLRDMLARPLTNDPRWFELSARACVAQSRASVGLVHGIAHILEHHLAGESPDRPFGHARLCSIDLKPVLALNRECSTTFDDLMRKHNLDAGCILAIASDLHDATAYDRLLPVLEANWRDVLRDPCSRTNSVLVRPAYLSFFTERRFL